MSGIGPEPTMPECANCGSHRGPWTPTGERHPSGAQVLVCATPCDPRPADVPDSAVPAQPRTATDPVIVLADMARTLARQLQSPRPTDGPRAWRSEQLLGDTAIRIHAEILPASAASLRPAAAELVTLRRIVAAHIWAAHTAEAPGRLSSEELARAATESEAATRLQVALDEAGVDLGDELDRLADEHLPPELSKPSTADHIHQERPRQHPDTERGETR